MNNMIQQNLDNDAQTPKIIMQIFKINELHTIYRNINNNVFDYELR